jgi:hypothetical protein
MRVWSRWLALLQESTFISCPSDILVLDSQERGWPSDEDAVLTISTAAAVAERCQPIWLLISQLGAVPRQRVLAIMLASLFMGCFLVFHQRPLLLLHGLGQVAH